MIHTNPNTQLSKNYAFRKPGRIRKPLYRLCSLIALVTTLGISGQSQTVVSPLWQGRGLILRDQLWSISVINGSTSAFTGRIELIVSDAVTSLPLFSGVSKEIIFQHGSMVLSQQRVFPVNYTILSGTYQFNPTINTLIPPGVFNVCYKIYKSGPADKTEIAGEGCGVLESDPLTPPTLVVPEDKGELNTKRPFFTWLPPVPNNTLTRLNYTIKVVEKTADQSPQEAIERNFPLLNQSKISQSNINYPSTIAALDTGKTYAWQVLAYNAGSYVAASESWAFTIKDESTVKDPYWFGFYVPMINKGSAQVIQTIKDLRVTYNNESGDTLLPCRIHSLAAAKSGKERKDILYDLVLVPGTNYLSIDLGSLQGIRKGDVYEIAFTNGRNERWWANFKLEISGK